MSLQDLPPEILYEVIWQSMPEGFENLMMTCRSICECGNSFIKTHNARKRAWRHISFRNVHMHLSALIWFHQIAQEPILARYIEVVEFDPNGVEFEPGFYWQEKALEQKKLQNDPLAMKKIGDFIRRSPYLRMAGIDTQDWMSNMFSYLKVNAHYSSISENLVFTFILTLLPNIKTLIRPKCLKYGIEPWRECGRPHDNLDVWLVMEAIRRNIGNGSQDAALGKLNKLQVIGGADYDTKIALRALSCFLAMPNITELYATDCMATNDNMMGIAYEWYYPDISSALRKIELVHCCMDGGGIAQLLAHTPQLQSFKFSRAAKRHGDGFDWNAGAFVAAIGKHVGHRLEDLAITLEDLDGRVTEGITSMREFTKLETLDLDLRVFDMPSIGPGEKCALIKKAREEGHVPWAREPIPPLAQILSPSLRRLELFRHSDAQNLDLLHELLVDFASCRPKALPKLEDCLIRDNGLPHHNHVEYEGVRWEFCFDAKPRWREEFYDKFMA
ncbi:hypothetical protein F5B20DRAFT_559932 [Whalleya microplaca]|nr:hypothetical protein F5B20DRAFT_559932 [Whalleya microplaca]